MEYTRVNGLSNTRGGKSILIIGIKIGNKIDEQIYFYIRRIINQV
jgi:hypothetical protein